MTATNLTDAIAQFKEQFRQSQPEPVKTTMAKATQDLIASGIMDQVLKVGETLPTITLPNATGQQVSIQDLLQSGPVVISFYRGGWCPYCNLELKALQSKLPGIKALGAQLVAISPETPDNSLSTSEKNALEFEVLSDAGNQVAKSLGLVFTLPEELRPLYAQFGIDLPAYNGDSTFELPIPATYIVAQDGTIALAFADPDYTKRLEPSEIITTLEQLAT
ncbi:MAG: AhpC/TSA family protein [Symploca sp. SIO2B6]|nr:AhpC/TSA family protein [Symploca sp. SIO2B6]